MPEAERMSTTGGLTAPESPVGERPESSAVSERSPEGARESAGEKYREILKKVSGSGGPVRATDVSDEEESVDAQSVLDEMDTEARVNKLLSLAETKSPEYAVRVAMKLNDFYVLDRMHDEMAERFYSALVERGVIKE